MSLKIGELVAYIRTDNSQFDKGVDQSKTKLASFGSMVAKAALAVSGLMVVKKIAGFLVEAGKAAQEDATRFAALQTIMKNQGQASDALVKSMEGFIDAEKLGAEASEEELVPALARLQAATKDVTKTQELANVAEDVAVGRHIDLTAAATALAKGSQGTLTALQRMGVAIKDSAGKALSFDEILANLKATYGGAAAAVANADPWKKLAAAWEVLKEKLGRTLLPAINKMMPGITKFIVNVGNAIENGDWGAVGGLIGKAIGDGLAAAGPVIGSALSKALPGVVKGVFKGLWHIGYDAGYKFGSDLREAVDRGLFAPDPSIKAQWLAALGLGPSSETFVDLKGDVVDLGKAAEASSVQTSELAGTIDTILGNAGLLRIGLGKKNVLSEIGILAEAARIRIQDWKDAIASVYQNINLGSIWDKAKQSLKSYRTEVEKELANLRVRAAKMSTLKEWFPELTDPEMWKEMASMPGFALQLVKEGKDAAQKDILAMAEVLALGGDKGAQAYVDAFGKPKLSVTVSSIPINVTALWNNVQSLFTNNPIRVTTSTRGGYINGHALGGTFTTPHFAAIAEEGPETIIPWGKPARAKEVMQEVGIGMDSGPIVAAVQRLGDRIEALERGRLVVEYQRGY